MANLMNMTKTPIHYSRPDYMGNVLIDPDTGKQKEHSRYISINKGVKNITSGLGVLFFYNSE